MLTQIYNGKILIPGARWIDCGSVVIRDSHIEDIYSHSRRIEGMDKYVNARGSYVMPGGIDMHVHGGGGRDFMEASEEAFKVAVAAHRRHGTTGIFPTLASSTNETIRKASSVCQHLMDDPESGVLGLHLEGPYLSPKMVGAQMPEIIRLPDPWEYESIVEDFPCIRRWDAAPEIPGACEFGRYITSKGIIAGLGHTTADFNDVRNAFDAGYNIATHFYNAMTISHKEGVYKHEGTVESVYLMDGIFVEVIADGIHVPPLLLRLIYKFKGRDRMCLITDALACSVSDSGKAFDPRVIVEDGVCKLADRSAIAGSIATMDRLIRTAVREAEIPLADVSRMVSENPARIMGVYDRKGSLAKRKDADIIIMDTDLNLTNVFAMGKEVEGVSEF